MLGLKKNRGQMCKEEKMSTRKKEEKMRANEQLEMKTMAVLHLLLSIWQHK